MLFTHCDASHSIALRVVHITVAFAVQTGDWFLRKLTVSEKQKKDT